MKKEKLKVDTVEQFKVLKYIRANFEPDYIKLELVDRLSIKVTDLNKDSVVFKYENGEIKESEENFESSKENFVKESIGIFLEIKEVKLEPEP